MSESGYVLVWDLDRTLGLFDDLSSLGPNSDPVDVQVRADLRDTLDRLSAAGFIHRVLTLASPSYAHMALHGTGLADAFVAVEGRGERGKGDVEGIAAEHGIPEERWGELMFFVGDHMLFDAPRHSEVVFHFEPKALTRSAVPCGELILQIREQGEGSLYRGFTAMFEGGTPMPQSPALVRRTVEGLPTMLLARPSEQCPVIMFENDPEPEATPSVHRVPWL